MYIIIIKFRLHRLDIDRCADIIVRLGNVHKTETCPFLWIGIKKLFSMNQLKYAYLLNIMQRHWFNVLVDHFGLQIFHSSCPLTFRFKAWYGTLSIRFDFRNIHELQSKPSKYIRVKIKYSIILSELKNT